MKLLLQLISSNLVGCIRFRFAAQLVLLNWIAYASRSRASHLDNPEGSRLFEYVFVNCSYNPLVRPVSKFNQTVDVVHDFAIKQVINVDVKQEQMTVLFWQRMSWVDRLISWDPADFGNVTHFTISPLKIWVPDIVVYNRVANFAENKQSLIPLMVHYDGKIQWNQPVLLVSTCNIRIRHFPYDKQRCEIKIGSWIHSAKEITITNERGHMDERFYLLNGEWSLLETSAVSNKVFYGKTPYDDVAYYVMLKRRPKFYEKNIVIPTALISLLATLTFLLPPESGEKIGLSITVFLALCVNLLLVAEMMPATSLETPIIGEYYLISISMVALSLVATVFVLNIHNAHSKADPPPPAVKFVLFKCIAPLVLLKRIEKLSKNVSPQHQGFNRLNCSIVADCTSEELKRFYQAQRTKNGGRHHQSRSPNTGGASDLFTTKNVLENANPGVCNRDQYGSTNHVGNSVISHSGLMYSSRIDGANDTMTFTENHSLENCRGYSMAAGAQRNPSGCPACSCRDTGSCSLVSSINNLNRKIDLLSENLSSKESNKEDDVIEDWHFLARVLDRLFALTSFIIIVTATVALIAEARNGFDESQFYKH